ncbi:hypothetical protein YC2023_012967 [Brassica napus]
MVRSIAHQKDNEIHRRIFSHLKWLEVLDLFYLNTTTTIDLNDILSYFKWLRWLDLSGNHVSATNKSPVSDLPLLYKLHLSGCSITEFPEFVKSQNIERLDISNNKIKGQVPGWLWTLSNLYYLDISNNSFTGFKNAKKHGLSLMTLLASNNNFTGNIPAFICRWRNLSTLDLSKNNFIGSIPRCLGINLKYTLRDLNLRQNRLQGRLPENIFGRLRTLDVGHNQLTGKLPRSLIRFSSLEVLNVESNMINDTFPFWLRSLPELKILVLRSNAFHGLMHQTSFPKLQIIDISHNHFNGALPSDYFVKWIAMSSLGTVSDQPDEMYMGYYYYQDSMLSGLVPGGTQFRRQNCTSFEGNMGLSGPSLDEICRDIHASTPHETPESEEEEEEEEEVLTWITAVKGVIPGIAFGWVIGYILVYYKPEWFMNHFVQSSEDAAATQLIKEVIFQF